MNRYAIFVDAGYLLAAAGDLCFGTSRRGDLILHPEKATLFLRTRCDGHAKQVHLRTYWYDAAPDAVPTDDQLLIGGQQGVKLRLGRLTKHGQKGVDSRIVRDLIVLSRNGAVRTAYLMSGDEDVREGVVEAQEFGVSVILLGIEPRAGASIRQRHSFADDLITLSRRDCTRFISRSAGKTGEDHLNIPVDIATDVVPVRFGEACGEATRAARDAEAVARILANRPRIPRLIDVWLIKEAANRFEDPLSEKTKHAIRAGFWKGLSTGKSPAGGTAVDEASGCGRAGD
ncbi:NYN domain-containing protein [Candidatus Palauibacter sp.]|uniref:NYN domain-containing protein n=1 Tax=Candidatus Palauibacter sp. TaxID=3101350 RepID=UPI003B016621